MPSQFSRCGAPRYRLPVIHVPKARSTAKHGHQPGAMMYLLGNQNANTHTHTHITILRTPTAYTHQTIVTSYLRCTALMDLRLALAASCRAVIRPESSCSCSHRTLLHVSASPSWCQLPASAFTMYSLEKRASGGYCWEPRSFGGIFRPPCPPPTHRRI